jgi:hypothetical protein
MANVARALYFDWSDVGIHSVISSLCVLAALRWPRFAAATAASIVLTVTLASLLQSEPVEWAHVRTGDDWKQVQRTLGPVAYSARNLEQARRLDIGYSVPSPLRFRPTGAVAIYLRGEYALWVVHDDKVVRGRFVGGS